MTDTTRFHNSSTMTIMRDLFGFHVIGRLGSGARSVIYRVVEPGTRRVYALKRVTRDNPELDDPCIAQVENEYAVSRDFAHKNLRRSLQLFKTRRYFLFGLKEVGLLMELADGSSLLEHREYAFPKMTEIFKETAEGLAEMHRRGLVHADMKPHNIIVSTSGAVKIVDYGQSCPIGTVKARVQGTPDYIAPEQVVKGALDQRTDVYNLGATMYWAFTGANLPSVLDPTQGAGRPMAQRTARTPSQLNPHIPAALDKLIMECCRFERRDRPLDMNAVLARLEPVLRDAGPTWVTAHRPPA
jgi:serine/threonine-protein kinase